MDFPLPYGAGEMLELWDDENGHWIYRSECLTVEITRTSTTHKVKNADQPLTYLVAHIYQRDYDSFLPAFASDKRNSYDTCYPVEMAARYNGVLWITGDNLTQGEGDSKGVLIRGGKIFNTKQKEDCLILHPDTLTLEIVKKNSRTAEDIFESGIENSFSFLRNPALVIDGVHQTAVDTYTQLNPRCGIGQVEPGHFIAIVADGRQPEYSTGVTLSEFAEMFIAEGCTLAYNLDGGVSTSMLFMGKMLNNHAENGGKGANASWQRKVPEGLVWGVTKLDYPHE